MRTKVSVFGLLLSWAVGVFVTIGFLYAFGVYGAEGDGYTEPQRVLAPRPQAPTETEALVLDDGRSSQFARVAQLPLFVSFWQYHVAGSGSPAYTYYLEPPARLNGQAYQAAGSAVSGTNALFVFSANRAPASLRFWSGNKVTGVAPLEQLRAALNPNETKVFFVPTFDSAITGGGTLKTWQGLIDSLPGFAYRMSEIKRDKEGFPFFEITFLTSKESVLIFFGRNTGHGGWAAVPFCKMSVL